MMVNLFGQFFTRRPTNGLSPHWHDDFEQGEFGSLRDWLREHLHRHGRKFTPLETLERVSGAAKIDPEPYVRYLRSKLGEIYGLPVAG